MRVETWHRRQPLSRVFRAEQSRAEEGGLVTVRALCRMYNIRQMASCHTEVFNQVASAPVEPMRAEMNQDVTVQKYLLPAARGRFPPFQWKPCCCTLAVL